jgi:hypothetical protein
MLVAWQNGWGGVRISFVKFWNLLTPRKKDYRIQDLLDYVCGNNSNDLNTEPEGRNPNNEAAGLWLGHAWL